MSPNVNKTTSTNTPAAATTTTTVKKALAPDERISSEAKAYWATIDLYNNSKMAFNKRMKSVKLKREKLNIEIKQYETDETISSSILTNVLKQKEDNLLEEETCSCVKCSIVYHESLIKGTTDLNTQTRPCNKCSSSTSSSSSSSSSASIQSPRQTKNNFDEKLFTIKNELVNLSETSLDVFQLLLQLSDTMLELNTQLNTSTNSNRLLSSNANQVYTNNAKSSLNSSSKSILEEDVEEDLTEVDDHDDDDVVDEDVYVKTNSIASIINSLNNKNNKRNEKNNNSMSHAYDKTSITQFVDSLLNKNQSPSQTWVLS
jgi:hypothetical protein